MRTVPVALESHLKRAVTNHCFCWTLERKDGVRLGFTDHDMPLTLDGVIHDPQTGFNASVAEAELGMQTGSMDLDGALRSDRISQDDIRAGKYDGADVKAWLVNWREPEDRMLLRVSRIGRIETQDGAFKVELQSMAEAMDRRRGRLVRRACDAELGDARCGKSVSSAAYTSNGTVVSAQAQGDFFASGLSAYAPRWFEYGTLEWLTGNNSGQVAQVAVHEVSGPQARLALLEVLPFPVAGGDTFKVTAGCDKSFATCKAKFANPLNFRGFPHLPGNDAVYTYASGDGIFDGAPLVP
jgi:uncharacterized phage protein (TIGR02218 family)